MRAALVAVVALIGCHQEERARAAWPACVAVDPGQPDNRAGNVTHLRVAMRGEGMVLDNVHVHDGGKLVLTSRMEYFRVGDHFEGNFGALHAVMHAHGPADAPTAWEAAFTGDGYDFEERVTYDGKAFVMTSIDPGPGGKPALTVLRFHAVPCAEVDAAIAKATRDH